MTDLGACPTCRLAGIPCEGAHTRSLHMIDQTRSDDGTYSKVIVLDAADDVPEPEYIVTGWAWCVRCQRQVWLGDASGPQVLAGAGALCLRCANDLRDALSPDQRQGRVHDSPA